MITHLPPFRWLDDTSDAVTATPHNPPPRPRAQTAAPGGLPRVAGRVGALAVALGIGAAVLAMPGLAAADDSNQQAQNAPGADEALRAVGPGTAAHPNAGWLFGKGFSYDASSCPAGKSCKGGNGGLIGHGGNGYNGGDGGNAGWIGHGGRGGAVVSVPPGANTNNLKGKDGRGGKIFGRDGGQLGSLHPSRGLG